MSVFSMYIGEKDRIIKNKEKIASGLEEFYIENYDHFGGRNVNSSTLDKREELFESYIASCIK